MEVREIKFRGKRTDNSEWVYGSLIQYPNGEAVIAFEKVRPIPTRQMVFVEVDPETVGQHIGFKDRDGIEIYEGDVLYDGEDEFTVHPPEWFNVDAFTVFGYRGTDAFYNEYPYPEEGEVSRYIKESVVVRTIHDDQLN